MESNNTIMELPDSNYDTEKTLNPFILSTKKKIYGLDWFGAKSQAYLIEKALLENKIVIKMVYKYEHLWTICDENTLLKLIYKTDSFLSEVLFKYPKKVYFDVDFTKTEDNGEEFDKFNIQIYIDILIKLFEDADIAVSGSEEPNKKSYHIIINNYILQNEEDLEKLKFLVKDIKITCPYFDDKVYTKNRVFKCINQKKDKTRLPQLKMIQDDDKKHFVSSFFLEELYAFDYETEIPNLKIQSIPKITKEKQSFTFSNDYHKKLEEFDILDFQEPANLLKITPINTETNHSHTWKVFLFSYYNGLSFNQFWEWASLKGADRQYKYRSYWDRATKGEFDKYKVSINNFINYLGSFYPIFHNTKNFNDIFTNIFFKSIQLPTTTLKNRIELEHYLTPHKAIIFNIGMGGGKTTTTIKYLNHSKLNFAWISPRITLANNTQGLISKTGLDILNYKTIKKVGLKSEKYNEANNLMISTESLHYLDKDYYKNIIIVDEIETVLNSWVSKTHGENLSKNFERFCSICKKADKIILLDAFTTKKTTDFLNDIGISNDSIIAYDSPYKPIQKDIYLYDSNDFDYHRLVDEMITKLNQGKKIYCLYSFVNSNKYRMGIVDLYKHLVKHCPDKKICEPYYGENEKHKKTLTNVNDYWKQFDCILTTSCITVGVNFDSQHFDDIYMFPSSYCVKPRDLIQASMRIRTISSPVLKIYFFDKENQHTFKYPDCFKAIGKPYENLCKNIRTEYEADYIKSFELLCSLSNYKIINKPPSIEKDIQAFTREYNGNIVQFPFDEIDDVCEEDVYKLKQKFDLEPLELAKISKFIFFKEYKQRNMKHEDIRWLWDNNLKHTFDNLYCDLLQRIYKDNNANDFRDINFKTIKLSKETEEYIKTNYNCLLKSPIKKILDTTQTELKKSIISSRFDKKSKNSYYKLTKKAERMYDVMDYVKLWKSYLFKDEEPQDYKESYEKEL